MMEIRHGQKILLEVSGLRHEQICETIFADFFLRNVTKTVFAKPKMTFRQVEDKLVIYSSKHISLLGTNLTSKFLSCKVVVGKRKRALRNLTSLTIDLL